jgi:hypothetical protein
MIISQAKVRHISQRIQQDGWASVGRQATRKAALLLLDRWALAEPELPLRPGDIVDSAQDSRGYHAAPATGPLRIGWVCTPPGAGSGGHTTLFRMVRAMEDRGHQCTLFLYDRNSDDPSRHVETIRRHWPALNADVRSATDGLEGVDAVVASSWASAHVVAARAPRTAHPFYFIQDYEPYFYPRGAPLRHGGGQLPIRIHQHRLGRDDCRGHAVRVGTGAGGSCPVRLRYVHLPSAPRCQGSRCPGPRCQGPRCPGHCAVRSGVLRQEERGPRGYLLAKLALEQFHEQSIPSKRSTSSVTSSQGGRSRSPITETSRPGNSTACTTKPSQDWRSPSPTSHWCRGNYSPPATSRSSTKPPSPQDCSRTRTLCGRHQLRVD